MPSIFSRIVAGEIPCHKIAETEDYLAFLDVSPRAVGHTLVIPKLETDYIFDMEDEALAGLMLFAKRVARAVEACVPCARIGVAAERGGRGAVGAAYAHSFGAVEPHCRFEF